MIGFSIIQRLSDWFKGLPLRSKFLMVVFLVLLILFSPSLYHRVTWLYHSRACSISGGEWAVRGMAENAFCLRTYQDAGKPCQSSEECMGGCVLYEVSVGQPPPSEGVCKINNDAFECFAVIEYPHLYGCAD